MPVNDALWAKLSALGLAMLALVATLLVMAINPMDVSLIYLALLAVTIAVGLLTNVWGGSIASAVSVFAIVMLNQYSGVYPRENLIVNTATELIAFLLIGPLAGSLSIAIDRVQRQANRWLARTEELTVHDDTFGTLRFPWAKVRLEEETMRAAQFRRPLSVAILQLEPHPEAHKQNGHDRVAALQGIVRLARSVTNPPAVVTYAGNDQVLLILPEYTSDQARQLAQTLAERAARARYFPDDKAKTLGKPLGQWGELRFGLASLNGNAETAEGLMNRAREKLEQG